MNIFRLHNNPEKAAAYHCDKHMKMIVESAQIMSTCIRCKGTNESFLYNSFNPKHPSILWAMESKNNFEWLGKLGIALGQDNLKRYKKVHKSQEIIQKCLQYSHLFPDIPETTFKLAMPPQFATKDPVHSYRLYYAGAKFRFAVWNKLGVVPDWWDEYRNLVKTLNLEVINEKNDGV